jgi:nucleotide-binding universal stress UspA family protein
MFEKVLVPTDFSPYAQKVMECVGDIPGVKEVVLLNVVSRPTITRVWDPAGEIRTAEKKLAEEKKFIKSGIIVKTRSISVLGSEIASAIQKVVAEEKPSLVVMGARGRSLIQSALLGSVSRNVLRFGDQHLLIMRYKKVGGAKGLEFPGAKGTKGLRDEAAEPLRMEKYCADLFTRVLVPTDFSLPEEAAISFLKSIPGMGEIHLLHVVSRGESKEEIDALVKSAEEMLKNISQDLGKNGIKSKTYVVVGSPVEEICGQAEEKDVSLIAMSSVGKDTMHTGRIGSRTYDVANTANRPVLVIRMRPVFSLPAS